MGKYQTSISGSAFAKAVIDLSSHQNGHAPYEIKPVTWCDAACLNPTAAPTSAPTDFPTAASTSAPTDYPTAAPTKAPTSGPIAALWDPIYKVIGMDDWSYNGQSCVEANTATGAVQTSCGNHGGARDRSAVVSKLAPTGAVDFEFKAPMDPRDGNPAQHIRVGVTPKSNVCSMPTKTQSGMVCSTCQIRSAKRSKNRPHTLLLSASAQRSRLQMAHTVKPGPQQARVAHNRPSSVPLVCKVMANGSRWITSALPDGVRVRPSL